MGKLLPIIMLLVGVGAGIGAGIVLAPAPEETAEAPGSEGEPGADDGHEGSDEEHASDDHGAKTDDHGKPAPATKSTSAAKPKKDDHSGDPEDPANAPEFVKLNNQFVVPVVAGGQVEALVVVSLSLETDQGIRDVIYKREPKLRDAFLQVLFDHSNMGGFQGAFTRSNNLDVLREALRQVARNEFGDVIHNVLIVDIARQDV